MGRKAEPTETVLVCYSSAHAQTKLSGITRAESDSQSQLFTWEMTMHRVVWLKTKSKQSSEINSLKRSFPNFSVFIFHHKRKDCLTTEESA